MLLLKALEYAAGLLAILFVVTQVVLPAFRHSPLFPILRRRGELERQLFMLKEEEKNAALESEVKSRVSALHKSTNKGGK